MMGLFSSSKKRTTVNNTTTNFNRTNNQAAQDNAIVVNTGDGGNTTVTTTDFDSIAGALDLTGRAIDAINQNVNASRNSAETIAKNAINKVGQAFETANTDVSEAALKANQRTVNIGVAGLIGIGLLMVIGEAFGNG